MARIFEFAVLFFAIPTAFTLLRPKIPAIPALWILMSYCLVVLLRDPSFNRELLWNAGAFPKYALPIFALYALGVLVISSAVLRFAPGLWLNFPRENPVFWGLVMVLYPILSVYPQGIIYRAFLFERYRGLFGPDWVLILASAAAFAYVHIIFRNPIAIGLTFVGGLIFATRYLQSESLFVSSLEHALYGCLMFTVGLGRSFYHAAAVSR